MSYGGTILCRSTQELPIHTRSMRYPLSSGFLTLLPAGVETETATAGAIPKAEVFHAQAPKISRGHRNSTDQPTVALYVNTGNPGLAGSWWPAGDQYPEDSNVTVKRCPQCHRRQELLLEATADCGGVSLTQFVSGYDNDHSCS
jgi:hypothetical protein